MELILLTANCVWARGSLSYSATGLAGLLSEIAPVDRDWESIKSLTSRTWFHRLWIVQEIALGNDPVVVCGKHTFPWCALTLFLDFAYMFQPFPAVQRALSFTRAAFVATLNSLPNARAISLARKGQNDWPEQSFLYSLWSLNSGLNSTDPRDRIYALLGLATAKKYRDALRPDYGIKVEDLFVEVARQLLMNKGSIQLLHMAGIGHRHSLSLPSWVPDWTSLPSNMIHKLNLAGNPAQEGHPEVYQRRFSFGPTSPVILTLQGEIVDSISLIIRDPYPDFLPSPKQSYYKAVPAYVDAVMGLVYATYPESVGKPAHEGPWTKPLMETLTASGSPLAEIWACKNRFVDDQGTTIRTPTVTEAGFAEFLERWSRSRCDRYLMPEESDEESDFRGFFFTAVTGLPT
ncbi:hypothetical protein FJTKL_13559 [Diaporthe vaccinii]|uniref:Heterokaryon incompatibility domain-containing protein n=1 Tax=Diaporthe vaccinii TaxID=105482 RepID=A0ABR4E9P7_9PEZI